MVFLAKGRVDARRCSRPNFVHGALAHEKARIKKKLTFKTKPILPPASKESNGQGTLLADLGAAEDVMLLRSGI